MHISMEEGSVLFNNALNTLYLQLYGVISMKEIWHNFGGPPKTFCGGMRCF